MEEVRRTDIKIIVGRGSVVRRARSEAALIREILRHNDLERAYTQLKLMLCAFERAYRIDKSVPARVGSFFRRLARACVEQGRVSLFLRAWKESTETCKQKSLESVAVTWFAFEAQKAFGENGQAAADFALALLEKVHHAHAYMEDQLLTKGRSAPSLSMDALEHNRDAADMIVAYLFVYGAFMCPPESTSFPGKAWIERLYERVEEPAIHAILDSVQGFSRLMSTADDRTQIEFWHQWAVDACLSDETLRVQEMVVDERGKVSAPNLVLSERLLPHVRCSLERRSAEITQLVERGCGVLASFGSRVMQVADDIGRMCYEIETRPRRGLRPNGLDHIEVRLTPLNNAGILGLIFHPEGHNFPDVGIEIVYQKMTPHLLTYRTTMNGLEHVRWEELYCNERHIGQERLLHLMLCYMAYDALHRIVTEQRPIREHPSRKGGAGGTGQASVRPYMRMLPVGHRVSNAALEAAQRDMGYLPPQGMTFVQAFFRNNELEYDMPSEPFAIYGDEDIELETEVK